MKIAIIIGFFHSGMQYMENVIAGNLAEKHEIKIFSSNRSLPGIEEEEVSRNDANLPYAVLRLPVLFRLRNIVFTLKLFSELQTWKPNAILVFGVGQIFPVPVLVFARRCGIPMLCFFSDAFSQYSHIPVWLRVVKRIIFYFSKGIIYKCFIESSITSYGVIQDSLKIINPIVRNKLVLQPLPYNKNIFFFNEVIGMSLRNELRIPETTSVFLASGRLVREKRFDVLIEAFSMIPDAHDAMLIFVGERNGDACCELRQLCGNKSNIIFLPMQPPSRLNAFFNMADFGIWPKQPAITIQQGLATGIYCLLPQEEYYYFLTKECGASYLSPLNAQKLSKAMINIIENRESIRADRERRAVANKWLSSEFVCEDIIKKLLMVPA